MWMMGESPGGERTPTIRCPARPWRGVVRVYCDRAVVRLIVLATSPQSDCRRSFASFINHPLACDEVCCTFT